MSLCQNLTWARDTAAGHAKPKNNNPARTPFLRSSGIPNPNGSSHKKCLRTIATKTLGGSKKREQGAIPSPLLSLHFLLGKIRPTVPSPQFFRNKSPPNFSLLLVPLRILADRSIGLAMATGELACSYAALILHDDGIPITVLLFFLLFQCFDCCL